MRIASRKMYRTGYRGRLELTHRQEYDLPRSISVECIDDYERVRFTVEQDIVMSEQMHGAQSIVAT